MRIDVVVIGGSLAGAACARELQRRGVEAVALERDVFPRPKVCGCFLSPNAVECLARLGLIDAVRAAGAVDVDHARIHAAGQEIDVEFRRNGLGISRSTLDDILAANAPVQQGTTVCAVAPYRNGFMVTTDHVEIEAKAVIDAAGKLSRFTGRMPANEFGVQYTEERPRSSALNFWFFEDGYGGSVTVEDGRSNFCFLIQKDGLRRYVSKPGRLVTGPLAYERKTADTIAIGDAAGMIDPFCGEGMHHALDSGVTAAQVVDKGLRDKRTYAEMRQAYELEWSRRWSGKRLLSAALRTAIRRPRAVRMGVAWKAGWLLDRLWATIPS